MDEQGIVNMKFYCRHLSGIIILLICILILPVPSVAMDFAFEWEANPEPVTGYKLYYKIGEDSGQPYQGTGLNEGASPITVGKVTTYTVTGMAPDKIYHFTLTAYNDDGESGYSSIVTVFPAQNPDPVPTINNISIN